MLWRCDSIGKLYNVTRQASHGRQLRPIAGLACVVSVTSFKRQSAGRKSCTYFKITVHLYALATSGKPHELPRPNCCERSNYTKDFCTAILGQVCRACRWTWLFNLIGSSAACH